MVIYKFIRYIVFFIIIALMCFSFFPTLNIPVITPLQQSISSIYEKIISNVPLEDYSVSEKLLGETKNIIEKPHSIINQFFNDINTEFALNNAIDKNFNDLEYLIIDYLLHYAFFEDIILYYNDEILYKHNKFTPSSSIIFSKKQALTRGEIKVEFFFNERLIERGLGELSELVYIVHRSKSFHSIRYESQALLFNEYIKFYQKSSETIIPIDRGFVLYQYILEDDLLTPIKLFFVTKTKMGKIILLRISFAILIILMLMLLLFIDKKIIQWLQHRISQKANKEMIDQMEHLNSEQDTLDWLEHYVQSEESQQKTTQK